MLHDSCTEFSLKTLGILGGSFDPVHKGHIGLAKSVYQHCRLAELRLVPLCNPVHRQQPLASVTQRVKMLQMATAREPGLSVDEREITRAGQSYSIDTLRSFREEFPNSALCLVMGMDAFTSLNSWREWQSIMDYAHILFTSRPGAELRIQDKDLSKVYEARRSEDVQDIHRSRAGVIYQVPAPELDISSTEVRSMIAEGQELDAVLANEVISFIRTEGIYHKHR